MFSRTVAPFIPYLWQRKHAVAQMDSPTIISLRVRFLYSSES
ncbi:uncharacterized protein METZ01_LOCUS38226 [marine metagenome]|uniref:Uncharacterized protein n=1 Tax=marine metagenome TaxID=408172 RepID=A0A381R105_9ZZZZ